MTRDEVVEILRLRWKLTEQKFGDERADAWHEVLAHHDYARIRARLTTLVRQGQSSVELADLTAGIVTDRDEPRDIRPHPDRCWHLERTDITETHSRCNTCSADLYSQNDPRIASQWAKWVEKGRQEARNQRALNAKETA